MTDKKIIIHGVNVSECDNFDNISELCSIRQPFDECYRSCDEYENCYYKQLQRKTAECEELKKREKYLYNFLTNKYNYGSFRPMWGAYLLEYLFNEDLGDFFNEEEYTMSDTIKEKEKEITNLGQKCEKYEQALNEIENETKSLKRMNYGYDELDIKEDVMEVANDILDIISKAKDGKNE